MYSQQFFSTRRRIILAGILAAVCLFFIATLLKVQIIKRDQYRNNTVSTYIVPVDAARGEILDRNGSPLVTNKQGNSLIFNYSYFPTDLKERDELILSLMNLCDKYGQEHIDNLPIVLNADGTYSFIQDDEDEDIAEYIEWLKSPEMLNLNSYATADNCMNALIKRYELEDYSQKEARDIAAVCAEMKHLGFSNSTPYTFAEDVPMELVAVVMENRAFYRGVENLIVPYREFTDGTVAPHIVGRVAKISAEQYNAAKKETDALVADAEKEGATEEEIQAIRRNSYTMNDEIGSGGIESAMESYLRGKRGLMQVTIDSEGDVKEDYLIPPEQGNSVVLTIDTNLQRVAQKALEDRVKSLNVVTDLPDGAAAAAVVVMNVHNGEILACATYPSYDNNLWKENYKDWVDDKIGSPLWNRATMSTYEPGSTFKPCVAVAGLEEGVIDEEFTWDCDGYYRYFSDVEFGCAGRTAHGENNVTGAIDKSCNCFFFETGRLLGIDKIDKWANAFGLGSKTGVEINEAQGILAGKEYRESQGGTWHPGDTVQAAIGQSDHQFTLLQMCNYCATIANGGTRYVPHFVKAVLNYDYTGTVLKKEAVVGQELGIKRSNLKLVQEGMYKVANEGFCRDAFAGLPIRPAAKTGTSEVKKKYDGVIVEGNNGFLITYAPYDDPEIAIALVVETANTGAMTATIAADIYQYYFSEKPLQSLQQYNTFLG
ncbi:MAG: hypothetical protein K5836_02100 [Clostridiales bacterium]|nr:hypothetical protein [Clostridiales bacterium]